jgi:hypothetical protein
VDHNRIEIVDKVALRKVPIPQLFCPLDNSSEQLILSHLWISFI